MTSKVVVSNGLRGAVWKVIYGWVIRMWVAESASIDWKKAKVLYHSLPEAGELVGTTGSHDVQHEVPNDDVHQLLLAVKRWR